MRPFTVLAIGLILTASAKGQQNPSPADSEPPSLVLDAGGHSAPVRRAFFTPDNRKVITASTDKTIRIWDTVTGETVRVFRLPIGPGSAGSIHALAISPDGKTLAAGGSPYGSGKYGVLIHLLNLEAGQIEKVLTGHKGAIISLAFSSDGKRLASGGGDGTVRIYDVQTGKTETVLPGHAGNVRSIAFAPDGKRLASVDTVGRIWSLPDGKIEAVLKEGNHPGISVAWSPDGKTVAVGNQDATISLWEPNGKPRRTLGGLRNQVTSLSFTPDSKELLFTGVGYKAENEFGSGLVDVASGKERVRFKEHTNTVLHGSISRDGELAVTTGGSDHETFIWRTADGSVVHRLVGGGRSIWAVGMAPDGRSIAWGTINRGGTETNRTPLEHSFHLEELNAAEMPLKQFLRAQFTRGNRSLAMGKNSSLAVKENGRTVHLFPKKEREWVYCFSWLPDGRVLVGTSFGLYLYDAVANQILRKYTSHSGGVTAISTAANGRRFVTGSNDQTVRIWDPDQPTALLSLFFADQDWIAWTEEGVYAASANGERLMGWQVNRGIGTLASYYSAAQFRRSLYHPDVIRHMVRAGSLPKAFALAGKKPQEALSVRRVLPPSVVITSPTGLGTVRLSQGKIAVKATAQSIGAHPVTGMRLLVDGRPYQGQAGFRPVSVPKLGSVQSSWTVELAPGRHSITVLAESAVSRALSGALDLSVGGKEAEQPALYLVAVGINDYPSDLRLRFAASDADTIAQILQAQGRKAFRTVEAKVIRDKQATKQNIEQGMKWLRAKMTAQDVAVFFFSGHGGRDAAGNFYLVPVDVDLKNAYPSCVSGNYLKQSLAELPGRVIAMLDACHSGAASEGPRRANTAQADDLVRDLISEEYGIIVMSSSLGREYSLEGASVKQGYFTLALVEGLSGKADYNKDRVVYLNELDRYTTRRVQLLTQGRQNPIMAKPPTIRSFPLARP